jgi:photosystem II stability/assembly factor-like uncharacterized protein
MSGIVTTFTSVGPEELVVVLDRGPVLVSGNGGQNWTKSDLPGRDVQELSFSSPQAGWAVMISGGIYRTTDGGSHWSPAGLGT